VEHICDRAIVMYLGHVVEEGPVEALFGDPEHPYTRALMAAIPYPDPERRLATKTVPGEIPSPIHPPSGCRFHTRCPLVIERCRNDPPGLEEFGVGHRAACHVASAQRDEGFAGRLSPVPGVTADPSMTAAVGGS
jgi:oligopeptide/dipeptide ABC transporter ATP-binding protein